MILGYDIYQVALLFCATAGFLFSLVNFFRTGNFKTFLTNSLFIATEVEKMQYKTNDERVRSKQTFSPYKKDYIYDSKTNSLIEKEELIDVNAFIQSVLPTAIETILKKYLDNNSIVTDDNDKLIYDYSDIRDSLEIQTDYINRAEDYRERYNLPLDWSVNQIYDFISQKSEELKNNIIKSTKKEDNNNA